MSKKRKKIDFQTFHDNALKAIDLLSGVEKAAFKTVSDIEEWIIKQYEQLYC